MSSRIMLIYVVLALAYMNSVSSKGDMYEQNLLNKISRFEDILDGYRAELGIQEKPITKAAFFATIVIKRSTYGAGKTILFENVVTDIGDNYDPITGVFTAPANGTYFFQSTLLTDNGVEIWAHLDVNGDALALLNARGVSNRHGTGTQAMVVTLMESDEVKIVNRNANGKYYGVSYSTFSGYQL